MGLLSKMFGRKKLPGTGDHENGLESHARESLSHSNANTVPTASAPPGLGRIGQPQAHSMRDFDTYAPDSGTHGQFEVAAAVRPLPTRSLAVPLRATPPVAPRRKNQEALQEDDVGQPMPPGLRGYSFEKPAAPPRVSRVLLADDVEDRTNGCGIPGHQDSLPYDLLKPKLPVRRNQTIPSRAAAMQEISSTVVCDLGEIEALSPMVQQVRRQISEANIPGSSSAAKTHHRTARRDSWPTMLSRSSASDSLVIRANSVDLQQPVNGASQESNGLLIGRERRGSDSAVASHLQSNSTTIPSLQQPVMPSNEDSEGPFTASFDRSVLKIPDLQDDENSGRDFDRDDPPFSANPSQNGGPIDVGYIAAPKILHGKRVGVKYPFQTPLPQPLSKNENNGSVDSPRRKQQFGSFVTPPPQPKSGEFLWVPQQASFKGGPWAGEATEGVTRGNGLPQQVEEQTDMPQNMPRPISPELAGYSFQDELPPQMSKQDMLKRQYEEQQNIKQEQKDFERRESGEKESFQPGQQSVVHQHSLEQRQREEAQREKQVLLEQQQLEQQKRREVERQRLMEQQEHEQQQATSHVPAATATQKPAKQSHAPSQQDPQAAAVKRLPSAGRPVGLAGALMEGDLARLQKKKKDWEDKYCALACRSREEVTNDGEGVDFAYLIEVYAIREDAAEGGKPEDRIYVKDAVCNFVQGTVFTVKTTGEINKKAATHFFSTNSEEEAHKWLAALEVTPDVSVGWVGKDGSSLKPE